MIEQLVISVVSALPPVSKDNGDFDGNAVIDTHGIKTGVLYLIQCGSLAAAVGSVAEANAIKIQECDTVDGEFTDIEGAALSGPIAGDKDGKIYGVFVNLRKSHKRYQKVAAPHVGDGSGTASLLSILALQIDPQIAPESAADFGLEELVLA
ncbi:MAG TPA: hypothetical protein VLJ10_00415 [Candidatus Bathyarchaeia archaeon]|nr:hypothetical protein [Candidatus Bathyarchaeia archaeon]